MYMIIAIFTLYKIQQRPHRIEATVLVHDLQFVLQEDNVFPLHSLCRLCPFVVALIKMGKLQN